MKYAATLVLLAALLTGNAFAADNPLLVPLDFLQPTMGEAGRSFSTARTTRTALLADRMAYHADEVNAQCLAMFLGKVTPKDTEQRAVELTLSDAAGKQLAFERLTPVLGPKLPVLVRVIDLNPGTYTLKAVLADLNGAALETATCTLTKTADRSKTLEFPNDGIAINVHGQNHEPDGLWPISTGVPMPKATLLDCGELALLENGRPVPAQFTVRGTWTPRGYAKWVGVDFIARYGAGKPRDYRLVRRADQQVAPATPLVIEEAEDRITVSGGPLKWSVGTKQFAGIDKVWLNGEPIVDGPGGSYVVDDKGVRYDSRFSKDVAVSIEEVGPLRVTIAAKGAYATEQGDELCRFVIRITAYAGMPFVMVDHRTVNTIPGRFVDTRIADAGFEVAPAVAITQAHLSYDGRGHTAKEGRFVSLHQDRSDHCRILVNGKRVAEGRRSDGWLLAETANGDVSLVLRDVYQKYPKELEVDFGATKVGGKVIAHFWPKNGHRTYTDAEELARDQVYKVRWAHEGRLLDMRLPQKYLEVLKKLDEQEHWAGGAELAIVDKANNLTKAEIYDGQGAVIGNELVLRFDADAPNADALQARSALVQQAPHALSDPVWNCATGALGPIGPRDPEKFGPAEKLLDAAYSFYRRAIIDLGDEYGMWTYGGVHSNWQPNVDAANMTRVWQMCHYQNVFQAWLLYFRSGMPEHFDWARIHANQHMDVGVCNYRKYPEGKHSYARLGVTGGGVYHCKGFVPWGGNSSTFGHWIDISNYFVRYYLTGNRRGLAMAERWMTTIGIFGGSNEPKLPDPKRINPREVYVPLGELVHYYEGTWDPQALIQIERFAQNLDVPFVKTNSPTLSTFGKHWQDWYYDFARDPRVIERVKEFVHDGTYNANRRPAYYSFAAFLYRVAGDRDYLAACVPQAYEAVQNMYESPGERYHQYCLAHSNPAAMLLGRLPFFLRAINDAGIAYARAEGESVMPCRGGRVDRVDKWMANPRGWTNAGMTVLTYTEKPTKLNVVIDGPKQFGSFRGHYMLFGGFPKLNVKSDRNSMKARYAEQQKAAVEFPAKSVFTKDLPIERNVGVGRAEPRQHFPYVQEAANDPTQQLYHLEYSGDNIILPALFDRETGRPTPQVAVACRTAYWNATQTELPWRVKGAGSFYMRALDDQAVIDLSVQSKHMRYWMPTTVKIADANGTLVVDSSVFMCGERKEVIVKLDPKVNPSPWKVEMASSGDCAVTFKGAEELFFAVNPDDFAKVLPHIEEQGE